jgi:hypothetical protein
VLAPFWDAGSAQVLSSVAFRLLCFAGGIAVSSEADILFLPFGCDCGATGGSFSLPTLACLSCAIGRGHGRFDESDAVLKAWRQFVKEENWDFLLRAN